VASYAAWTARSSGALRWRRRARIETETGGERRNIGEEGVTSKVHMLLRVTYNHVGIIALPMHLTFLGFDSDRDSQKRPTGSRGFDFSGLYEYKV
jgi:hypothetical protein